MQRSYLAPAPCYAEMFLPSRGYLLVLHPFAINITDWDINPHLDLDPRPARDFLLGLLLPTVIAQQLVPLWVMPVIPNNRDGRTYP